MRYIGMVSFRLALALLCAGAPSAFALSAPAFPGASLDAFFDGAPGPGLEFPPAFTPSAGRSPAPSKPQAPTVSFRGLELKTYMFSEDGGVGAALAAAISKTQATLRVAVYSLTHPEVTDALVAAHERGVDLRVVVDYGHVFPDKPAATEPESARSSQLDRLIAAGVPLRVLDGVGGRGYQHNKFAVFDGMLLEAGSFNWTKQADGLNYENVVFRTDPALIAGFSEYWDWMWDQAKPLAEARRGGEPRGPPPGEKSPSLAFKGEPFPAYVFSPRGGGEATLIRAASLCKTSIEVAMFSFFSTPIAQALADAKARGVEVRVVLDPSQVRGSPARAIFDQAGIPYRLLAGVGGRGLLHNKYAVFDRELVETGSFNYSFNAENYSFENMVFSTTPSDAAGFSGEFEALFRLGRMPSPEDPAAPSL